MHRMKKRLMSQKVRDGRAVCFTVSYEKVIIMFLSLF